MMRILANRKIKMLMIEILSCFLIATLIAVLLIVSPINQAAIYIIALYSCAGCLASSNNCYFV